MSVISNSNNLFCENHFVFIENNILLKKQEHHYPLTSSDLPDENLLRKCLENQIASDWYAEPSMNYSAMMLEKDSVVPAGCESIPVRQFFWETKNKEEQDAGGNSFLGGLSARAHGFLRLRENYRFCPSCGGKLIDDTEEVARKCTVCGRKLFPRIEPAIIILVSRGDEILLVKNKNRSSDFFSCIAGFVEHGETIEQAAVREVREEVGLEIENLKYVGSQPWPFPDQLMLAFKADYRSGTVKIQEEELDEAKWFKKDNLPPLYKPGSVAYNLITGKF